MRCILSLLLLFFFIEGFSQSEEYSNKRILNSFVDDNNIVSLSGVININNSTAGFSFLQEHFIKDGLSYANGITVYINDPDLVWFDVHHSLKAYLFHYTVRPFFEIKYSTIVGTQGLMLSAGGSTGVSYAEFVEGMGLEFSYNYISSFVNLSDINLPYNIQTVKLSLYYQW